MPRMSKKRKQDWALFLNERNRITYNELCRKCSKAAQGQPSEPALFAGGSNPEGISPENPVVGTAHRGLSGRY